MMDGERHSITLLEVHNLHARLHARALLSQHKFAARKVLTRRREQNRDVSFYYSTRRSLHSRIAMACNG